MNIFNFAVQVEFTLQSSVCEGHFLWPSPNPYGYKDLNWQYPGMLEIIGAAYIEFLSY